MPEIPHDEYFQVLTNEFCRKDLCFILVVFALSIDHKQ